MQVSRVGKTKINRMQAVKTDAIGFDRVELHTAISISQRRTNTQLRQHFLLFLYLCLSLVQSQ